ARRHNFQRIYDLAERVHPEWHDGRMPPLEDVRRSFVLHAVRALGLAKASWIPDYHRTRRPHPDPARMAEEGLLLRARVAGWDEPVYIHPDHAQLARQAMAGALAPRLTMTTLLSPFDPIVWDRRRALELFGFDYRLECYTPADKRRYGYFTLPILRRGALVGRVDAKAHRKTGEFELRSVHLEPGVRVSGRLVEDVAAAVRRCARWHDCPRVRITHALPQSFAVLLETAFTQADTAA
ncbi:MAG: winged helix-turn-helix domain-containing protein, partial [Lysobacteraceae bacterium]